MRHVVVMTLTGALGLMALFLVDLIDLFFLSLLNQTEVTAAIGYAGTIVFANLSITLGVGIAAAALVAQNLGAGKPERASQFATSTLLFALLISGVLTVAIALGSGGLLTLLGAQGEAKHLAQLFIWTMTPGYILISGAITCSFILRGLGDPRRAMYITLSTAVVTALADPLFIFGFGWGIQGAAAATVLGYTVSFIVGLHALTKSHNFLNPLRLDGLRRDLPAIWVIALPAVLTQLATPFANAYVTRAVAPFGDEAVAAAAIVGRLIPVAFGIIFALSGSVGPIIGQNYGARKFDRVKQTLRDGLIFAATDPAALRSLPKEPAEKAPSPLLNDFDAPYVFIAGVPGPGCIRAQVATAEPGGDGEIAWLVDGGASSDAVESQGSGAIEVGEPEVDGDLVTVPVSYADEETGGDIASREALGSSQVSYVC